MPDLFVTSIVSQQFCETDQSRGFLRGFQMQVLRGQGPLSTALGGYGKRLAWGAQHNRDFDSAFGRSISLTITCEDLPEAENRIEVDESRLDNFGMPTARMIYRLGENSLKMRDFGIARAREWLVRSRGSKNSCYSPFWTSRLSPYGDSANGKLCKKKCYTKRWASAWIWKSHNNWRLSLCYFQPSQPNFYFTVASSKGSRFDECKTCRSLTGRDAMYKKKQL